ncbi:acyltransferase family protein [Jeotgalicoccus marinus]|uniref:acyltransferase family protein n=1 Tax=Jeotgalicoccus marinus TaxID=516700 RepID=UPI00041AEE53|nr:acyltransferase family protein [Jeotgalicoccus marinus]
MNRLPFFDNARLILIFLVVFGHMIQPFATDSQLINSIYAFIYIFHMPMFILLAGFFAKGIGEPKYILKLAKNLLLPYFIFQVIYTGLYLLLGREDVYVGILKPQWAMWFLVSLFSWHILLILFKRFPAYVGIPLTVLIGISVGYVDLSSFGLSLSRTIVFFPFFLAGYYMNKEHVVMLKTKGLRIIGLIFAVVLFVFIYSSINIDVSLDTDWLTGAIAYRSLEAEISGSLMRLIIYVLATLLIIFMIAWIPDKNYGYLTKLGQNTLYVYLLHGFIIQPLREFDVLWYDRWYETFIFVIFSALIVLVLSSKPVVTLTRPLVELKWKK